MVDKAIIRNNFSRCAPYYDKYATIQRKCASRLVRAVAAGGFNKILDIGCGTGNYTGILRKNFPKARIKAIDISKEMVEVARKKLRNKEIEFIVADAETVNLTEKFDFITSNASLQWFRDLEKTLLKYRKLLLNKGVIAFSMFGPLTFCELNASLRELFKRDVSISSYGFIKKEKVEKVLRILFKKSKVDAKIYKENCTTLSELLKKIKYSGARGNGLNDTKSKNGVWTKNTIINLEEIYKSKYKNITATYEVFFCEGIK